MGIGERAALGGLDAGSQVLRARAEEEVRFLRVDGRGVRVQEDLLASSGAQKDTEASSSVMARASRPGCSP